MVITVDPDRRVIMDGAVAVENDRIIDVGETSELERTHSADFIIDATKMVVMPGLMDGHAHAGHSMVQGMQRHLRTGLDGGVLEG